MIEIGFQHLPDPDLNPNKLSRMHWAQRANATRIAREEGYWIAKALKIEKPIKEFKIEYVFTMKHLNHDLDNLVRSAKSLLDSCVDAGIIQGDSCKYMKELKATAVRLTQAEAKKGDQESTLIRIKEA